MKTTQKKLANNIIEITIEDTPKAYEQARKAAIENYGKRVQVKGFRKGANIPEALIVKEVGEAQIADAALDGYLRNIYPRLLSETKVSPVAPGQVTKIESLDPLVIVLEIEVLPEVSLEMKEIKKISLKKTSVTIEKGEVEEAIKEIEKRFTHFHPAGQIGEDGFTSDSVVINSGDRVTIDTQGFESQGGP